MAHRFAPYPPRGGGGPRGFAPRVGGPGGSGGPSSNSGPPPTTTPTSARAPAPASTTPSPGEPKKPEMHPQRLAALQRGDGKGPTPGSTGTPATSDLKSRGTGLLPSPGSSRAEALSFLVGLDSKGPQRNGPIGGSGGSSSGPSGSGPSGSGPSGSGPSGGSGPSSGPSGPGARGGPGFGGGFGGFPGGGFGGPFDRFPPPPGDRFGPPADRFGPGDRFPGGDRFGAPDRFPGGGGFGGPGPSGSFSGGAGPSGFGGPSFPPAFSGAPSGGFGGPPAPESPALAKLRAEVGEIVRNTPITDLASLATAAVVGSLRDGIDRTAEENIEGTLGNLSRLLGIAASNLSMFKQRVSDKWKEEYLKFLEKSYETELAQLLDALAHQTPHIPIIRNKLNVIVKSGTEKELNAIRARATKLQEEARRTREAPAALAPPTSFSAPAPAIVAPDPQRAAQEDMFCNAALSGDLTTVQTLLSQGVNINCAQQGGWTALMNATLQGHTAVVDHLVRAGADLNIKDQGGFTALMYAASYRRYNIAEALVKAGANLEITDNAGRNIHQYAQSDPLVKEAIQRGQQAAKQQKAVATPAASSHGFPTQGYGLAPTPTGIPAYGVTVPTSGVAPSATAATTPGAASAPAFGYGYPHAPAFGYR